MIDLTVVALIGLGLAMIVQGLLLVGLLRQVGQISRRLGGEHPMDRASSIEIGQRLPDSLLGAASDLRVVLFVSPSCSVCAGVLDNLARLVPEPRRVMLIVRAGTGETIDYLAGYGLGSYPYVADSSGSVADSMGIHEIPFAILSDEAGVVLRTAVVNTAYQVETMMESARHSMEVAA
jgi:hypothetical protein